MISKLGPREKGRKAKGQRKPQQVRQAKARLQAMKRQLRAA